MLSNAIAVNRAIAVNGQVVTHHASVRDRVLAVLRRGRREGFFRRDVPEQWLLTT